MGWGDAKSERERKDDKKRRLAKPHEEKPKKAGWGSGVARKTLRRENGRTLSALARKAGVKLFVDPVTGMVNDMSIVKSIRNAKERIARGQCPGCGKGMPKNARPGSFHAKCAQEATLAYLSERDAEKMADEL